MLNGIISLALVVQLGLQAEPPGDRMYGRVRTADGGQLEGYLRWDRNETHWSDILDGLKEVPREHDLEAERLDEELRRRREQERSISLPGLRISWDEDDGDLGTTGAGIRFGHVRSLTVVDDRRVSLVLVSGAEVDFLARSSDLGRAFRGLVVEDLEQGEVELRWRELDRVDFMTAPTTAAIPRAARLHGTLRTVGGIELTGFVAWDMDETLTTDVLDGERSGEDLEIRFGSIVAIARESRNTARVTLRTGEQIVLGGTNDVDSDNRGIEISDPLLGRAVVAWAEFESLAFTPPEARASGVVGRAGPGVDAFVTRASFDGGRALAGTVETRTGDRLTGRIRWDNDEEYSWEMLDGRSDGVEYDIELGLVRSIERVGSSSARVELGDGRSLLLEGSNDVDGENQGIFVREEGAETVLVRWLDFQRVMFAR